VLAAVVLVTVVLGIIAVDVVVDITVVGVVAVVDVAVELLQEANSKDVTNIKDNNSQITLCFISPPYVFKDYRDIDHEFIFRICKLRSVRVGHATSPDYSQGSITGGDNHKT